MPSKKSFFNRTLFRKNLSRTWPLWGLLSLGGALIPLYFLLELLQYPGMSPRPEDFATGLYTAVTCIAPGFTAGYAILCAMLVWGYLYNPRAVGMFHALPVSRPCLFATNTLSGLAMIVIPYAVTGFLICLLAVCRGFFDLAATVNTVLAVLLLSVVFFGLATLCAMLTGHIFVLPALYLLANFLSPILESLLFNLAQQFLIGISGEAERFNVLSPIVQIYTSFHAHFQQLTPGGEQTAVLHGLWVVALYALAGLVMLALAWLLYQKRHSERAGDVAAFRWLRPVFRYGASLLSGLIVGRIIYELMWQGLFQRGAYADALPMAVCMAVGGLLGYYAASMLLEKSRRVFRGSLPGAAIVCAGAAALCLLIVFDVTGMERRVPASSEIVRVQLEDRGSVSGPFDAEKYPEQVEKIRALHQNLIDNRDYIRDFQPNWDRDEGRVFSYPVWLTYTLENGTELHRYYDLWVDAGRLDTAGTYENLLAAFCADPVVRKSAVEIPEDADAHYIAVISEYGVGGDAAWREPEGTRKLYAALLQDADAGNIPARNIMEPYSMKGELLWLQIEYRTPSVPWDGSWNYGYKNVEIFPQMTHTVDALLELGYLDEAGLERWKQDLAREQKDMEEAVFG